MAKNARLAFISECCSISLSGAERREATASPLPLQRKSHVLNRPAKPHQLDLTDISKAEEFFRINHPHLGRVRKIGVLQRSFGLLTGNSRKAVQLQDRSTGKLQTIAPQLDASRFSVTIANSFILVTLKGDDASKIPIIQKKWRMVPRDKGKGPRAIEGTIVSYLDADGLKWEHRFKRERQRDEVVGFGNEGQEILIITLETFG